MKWQGGIKSILGGLVHHPDIISILNLLTGRSSYKQINQLLVEASGVLLAWPKVQVFLKSDPSPNTAAAAA